jgi:tRNA threonylcarbamoyladenosine biosynthesis protein TsaB
MRLLAIDTSGPALSLALFDGEALIAEHHEVIGRGHAEQIIPHIALLPGGGRADILIAGTGPGSFTGIRSGIAAARGLAIGWSAQVFGMNSLALIAAAIDSTNMLVAIEGGHGELFLQAFHRESDDRESDGSVSFVCALGPITSLTPEAAAKSFCPSIVAGNGAERFIQAGGSGQPIVMAPRAALVLSLPLTLRTLIPSPVYGRAPDAKAAA